MQIQTSWQPTTPSVGPAALPEVLAQHHVVVLHFWADWNAYDRQMDALLQDLRPSYSDQVAFFSFDTTPEEGWQFISECQILNLPALVCFIDGKRYETLIGLQPKPQLEAKLRTWLAAVPSNF